MSWIRSDVRGLRALIWVAARRKYPRRTEECFGISDCGAGGCEERPLIISFGTEGSIYEERLHELEAASDRLGHEHALSLFASGDANFIRRLKPSFIKLKLLESRRTVVWLDCDSQLREAFQFPIGNWDVGTMTHGQNWRRSLRSANVIAFRPSASAVRFLEVWEYLCMLDRGGGSDHFHFHQAFSVVGNSILEIDIKSSISGKIMRGKLGQEFFEI